MNEFNCVAADVKLGKNVKLSKFVNLYGCEIGDETKIGAFVEIQKNVSVGKRCKISSHTFICEGVVIEDNVFIGHGVMFINDTYPRATTQVGELQTDADWKVERTSIGRGASIGSNATILSKIRIGENAIVGAGSVVTKDVPPFAIVAGNPARVLRLLDQPEDDKATQAIPFLDLITPHRALEEELVSAFRQGLRTAGFVGGPIVEKFEDAFALFCDADHAIAVSSGTDALRFAIDGVRSRTGRCGVDGTEHVHCHDGGHFAGPRDPGVCRHRRAHLQHVGAYAGTLSGKAVRPEQAGKAHQPAEREAGYSDGAGPSLRADGRHGRDSELGGTVRSHGD